MRRVWRAAGLQRQEAVVVPTLVDEAASPSATELPASIAALASLHAVKLSGENLEIEIDKLVQSIQRGRNRSHGRADGSDSIGFQQH
jgi:hypothetical protein